VSFAKWIGCFDKGGGGGGEGEGQWDRGTGGQGENPIVPPSDCLIVPLSPHPPSPFHNRFAGFLELAMDCELLIN